jgi:hypothetical protein
VTGTAGLLACGSMRAPRLPAAARLTGRRAVARVGRALAAHSRGGGRGVGPLMGRPHRSSLFIRRAIARRNRPLASLSRRTRRGAIPPGPISDAATLRRSVLTSGARRRLLNGEGSPRPQRGGGAEREAGTGRSMSEARRPAPPPRPCAASGPPSQATGAKRREGRGPCCDPQAGRPAFAPRAPPGAGSTRTRAGRSASRPRPGLRAGALARPKPPP